MTGDFEYMVWAKAHAGGALLHLAASGLAPPPPELLGDVSPADLEQRAPDMPPAARALVAARYGVVEDRVMLSLGTSHALYLACRAWLRPGELVLVERPTYEVLRTLPAICGATVERVERRREDGWRLPADLPNRIRAQRPRLVLLSNPHNPSGALLSQGELAPVAQAVRDAGGILFVDEVYLEYCADAVERSALTLGPEVAIASSLTKAYGFGTVRFGWLVAAADSINRALRYNDYVAVLYPSPSAAIGVRALERLPRLSARAVAARARGLPVVREWVASRPDLRWHQSEAGVIALIELPGGVDARSFCTALERERQTVLVPGDYFEAPGTVRLGFGCDEATLREGLARFGAALDALRP